MEDKKRKVLELLLAQLKKTLGDVSSGKQVAFSNKLKNLSTEIAALKDKNLSDEDLDKWLNKIEKDLR